MPKDTLSTLPLIGAPEADAREDAPSRAFDRVMRRLTGKMAKRTQKASMFAFMGLALAACGGEGDDLVSGDDDQVDNGPEEPPVTPFGVSFSDGVATITGLFAFVTEAGIADGAIVEGSEKDGHVDVTFNPESVVALEEVSEVVLQDGVTVVGVASDMEGVSVTGNGNLWILIGDEAAPGQDAGEVSLNVNISGDVVFDMPSDADQVTLTGTVDLQGGRLIVSDGTVFADLATLMNVSEVVVNSTLELTVDQMAAIISEGGAVTGTGNVTLKIEEESDPAVFFDLLQENPGLIEAGVNVTMTDGEVSVTLDLESLVDSKIELLQALISKDLEDLAGMISDLESVQAEGFDAVMAEIAALQEGLTTLQSEVSEAEAALQAEVDALSAALTAQVEALTALIGGEVARLEGVIGDLDGELTAEIALVAGDLSALTDVVAALDAASAAGDAALQSEVDALSAALTALTESLADAVADLQDQIDDVVSPSMISGNELDNYIQLYPYAGQETQIRVEAGAGDDKIDGANVDSVIYGGDGSDEITLTTEDDSADWIVFGGMTEGTDLVRNFQVENDLVVADPGSDTFPAEEIQTILPGFDPDRLLEPATPQITTVGFSTDDADYFSARTDEAGFGTPGTVSITIDGVTYAVAMADDYATTMTSLQDALSGGILEGDRVDGGMGDVPPLSADYAVSFDPATGEYTVTGQPNTEFTVEVSQSVNGVQEVTTISVADFDGVIIDGVNPVTVEVAGETFTLDVASREELMPELADQLIAAIGLGTVTALEPAGVSVSGDGLSLTLTARYGEADPFGEIRVYRDAYAPESVEQVTRIGIDEVTLEELVDGDEVTVVFGATGQSATYQVGVGETAQSIMEGIVTEIATLSRVGTVSDIDTRDVDGFSGSGPRLFVDVTASVPGAEILGDDAEIEILLSPFGADPADPPVDLGGYSTTDQELGLAVVDGTEAVGVLTEVTDGSGFSEASASNETEDADGPVSAADDQEATADVLDTSREVSFDLSEHEFGFIGAELMEGAGPGDVSDPADVAAIVNSLYDFVATDNDTDNTTIFSVTVEDGDGYVTAVWAHQQSGGDDNTVDAGELTQLAVIESDAPMSAENLTLLTETGPEAGEILYNPLP